jgi:hypothetical protein
MRYLKHVALIGHTETDKHRLPCCGSDMFSMLGH